MRIPKAVLIAVFGLIGLGLTSLMPARFGSAWADIAEDASAPAIAVPDHAIPVSHHALPLDGTPITEPEPELHPLYLPFVSVDFDPLLPPPLESRWRGWVGALTPSGRTACQPATHVLLDLPEGTRGVRAIAVLRPMNPDDPALTLDLVVGEYVEVIGASEPPPAACIVTWQSLAVGVITVLDPPPP